MKVPLLDLNAQLEPIRDDIKAAVNEVIDSTRYVGGPKVEKLEEEIAAYCECSHAVGVTSGTDALLISLMALDITAGDIVLTTPYSFFATAGVVARLGARPVFVDIDPVSYNIDPEALAAWFEEHREEAARVKAIIPVHLYGQCADMDPILKTASAHGAAVIEDAAQAIGASYPSARGLKKAGSMGGAGCFSFFPSKNLGCMGDGGMVVTNDTALYEKIQKLRNHGATPKYYHAMVGGNFRLDPIQAAILSVKLPHLETWHQGRRENAAYYDEHFSLESIRTPAVSWDRSNHIYNQYIISLPGKRDELRRHLEEKQVGHEVYYPVPFHLQECFSYLGYGAGDFPKSEYAAAHTLALPIYAELTREMQDYVIESIQEFYR